MANESIIKATLKPTADLAGLKSAAQEMESIFKNVKVSDSISGKLNKEVEKISDLATKLEDLGKIGTGDNKALREQEKTYRALGETLERISETINRIPNDKFSEVFKIDPSNSTDEIKKLAKEVERTKAIMEAPLNASSLRELDSKIKQYQEKYSSNSKALKEGYMTDLLKTGDLKESLSTIRNFENSIWKIKDATQQQQATSLFTATKEQIEEVMRASSEYGERLESLNQALAEESSRMTSEYKDHIAGYAQETKETAKGITKMTDSQIAFNNELSKVKGSIAQFFGLANAVNIAQKAFKQAYATVKELDQMMTEVAVVTDYTVGDMWEKLPDYTKRATEYGLAIKSVYEADMLYYQQGLSTNEVVAVSNETLKMSRIASLSAADATDRMTNALRGFQMQINETSAKRVSDVYSELAAISATDVNELSIAMTKTASLAQSANMTFENTAALLTQIVETTREAPETAGTALKTVIARFSEVKDLYSKNELMGTDEEGQEIDVNKISKALRTAGIDLNAYFREEVGLDEIFFQLAERWGDLEEIQQKYIATMAAGSRQQSRFIAMIQDEARLKELVSSANDSAGASNKQYEKTVESLETKLARLTNAKDELALSLMNSTVLKGIVDAGTSLLNIINSLTNGVDGLSGSLLRMGIAIGTFKGLKGIVETVTDSVRTAAEPNGVTFGASFAEGVAQGVSKSGNKILDALKIFTNFKNVFTANTPYGRVPDTVERTSEGDVLSKGGIVLPKGSSPALKVENQAYVLASAKVDKLTRSYDALSLSMAVASGLTLKFSSHLKKVGYENAAVGLKGLGIALGTFSIALKVAKVAVQQFDLALSMTKIGIIAAGIGAVIGVISIVASKIETAAEKTKRLGEEAEQAAERYQELKTASEELKTSLEEIDSQRDVLSSMQEGTEEWTLATQELNEKILEVLGNYKFLAPYLSQKGGVLGFDEQVEYNGKNMSEALDSYYRSVQEAEIAKIGAQNLVIQDDLDNFRRGRGNGRTYQEENAASPEGDLKMDKLALLLAGDLATIKEVEEASNGQVKIAGTLGEIAESFSEFYDITFDMTDEFLTSYQELGNKIKETNSQIEANTKIMLGTTARNTAKEHGYNPKQTQAMINMVSPELLESQIEKNRVSKRKWQNDKEIKQRYKDYWEGQNAEVDTQGRVRRQGSDEWIAFDKAVEEFANGAALQDLATGVMVEGIEKMSALPEAFQKVFDGLEGEELNLEDVEKIQKASETELQEIYDSFVGDSETLKEAFPYDTWVSLMKDAAEISADAYEKAMNDALDRGIDVDELDSRLRASDMGVLSDALVQVTNLSGKEAANGLVDKFNKAIKGMDDSKLKTFMDQFSGIGDLRNIGDLENFMSTLEEMGVVSGSSVKPVREFIDTLINGAKALKGIDLDEFRELTRTRVGLIEQAKNNESGIITVSGEEYDRLIESNDELSKNFIKELDGSYTYIGTMENLISALEENSRAQYDTAKEEFDNKLGGAQVVDSENLHTLKDVRETGVEDSTLYQMSTAIKEFQKTAIDRGLDISKMGIDDLSNETKVSVLMGAETLEGILKQILGLIEQKDEIKEGREDLEKINAQELAAALSTYQLGQSVTGENGDIYSNELMKRASQAGVNPEYIDQFRETDDLEVDGRQLASLATTYEKAATHEVDLGELESRAKFLAKTYGLAQAKAHDLALEDINLKTGLTNLVDTYDNWSRILAKGATDDAVKSSIEYQEALQGINKDFEQMLGMEPGTLSQDFFENAENAALLEQAILGSNDALAELMKEGNREAFLSIPTELDYDDFSQQVDGFMNLLFDAEAQATLEATGTLDDGPAIEALNQLIKNAGLTEEEVNRLLGNMGYEPEIGFEEAESSAVVSGELPTGVAGRKAAFKEGQMSGAKVVYEPVNASVSTKVKVPVVKSIKKGGSMGRVFPGGSNRPTATPKSSGGRGGGGSPKGSGGSGKEKKPEVWANSYDKLYNLLEKINEAIRTREKLERQYTKLLEDRKTVARDVVQHSLDEIAALKKEIDLQQQLLSGRRKELQSLSSEKYTGKVDDDDVTKTYADWGITQYASYNEKTGLISIDWEGIDKITDTNKGGALEAYISRLEELQDSIEGVESTVNEIEDSVEDIRKRNKDSYLELEQRLYDAIVQLKQEIIDNYSTLNDSINDSNSKVLDSLQESIDLQRQIRDNTETEKELNEQERRLAFLQRDTSNANDLEAMQLEKSLEKSRQDYQDSLVDQALEKMARDNNLAAEQRATQINIMQAQLEYQTKIGAYWDDVYKLIRSSFNEDGTFNNNSALVDLLEKSENFKGLSYFGAKNWIQEMAVNWLKAQEGAANWRIDDAKESGSLNLNTGQKLTYNKAKDKWYDSSGNSYSNVKWDEQKGAFTGTNNKDAPKKVTPPTTTSTSSTKASVDEQKKVADAVWFGYGGGGWGNAPERPAKFKEVFGDNSIQAYINQIAANGLKPFFTNNANNLTGYTYAAMRKKYKGYKTGGLADYTGPAWLDGTPGNPELVLNSQDTKNFIALKDALSKVAMNTNSSNTETGDIYYEFDFGDVSLSNDYDFDRLTERIKKEIVDKANYRNSNLINLSR